MRKFVFCLALAMIASLGAWAQNRTMTDKANVDAETAIRLKADAGLNAIPEAAKAAMDYALGSEAATSDRLTAEPLPAGRDSELADLRAKTGTVAAPARKTAARKAAAKVVEGGYIAKDLNYKGLIYPSTMKLFKDAAGNYKMAKIYDLADTISLSVDLEAGTVTIPVQKVCAYGSYGDLWICPMDLSNLSNITYSTSGSITGTIDENGVIRLPSWGLIIIEGLYKGNMANAFKSSEWIPANGSIKRTDSDGTESTYDALVEQVSTNTVRIYNFAGNSTAVAAQLTPQKGVRVSPQQILYSTTNGAYMCYKADWTAGKINIGEAIEGTGTENTLTLGNWAVSKRGYSTGIQIKALSSVITTTLNISYPEAQAVELTGEGTEASPYLISTATDLLMLATAVQNGDSQSGKFIKQTKDINMAELTKAYLPVGDATTAFEGIYDGQGFTVSNLQYNAYGFSNTGVFGHVGAKGTVRNLNVKSAAVVSVGSNVGVVAGTNYGTVEQCAVTLSTVSANSDVAGGVVGLNYGTVSHCSFSGTMSNTGSTGGITGYNRGTVSKCYSEGTVALTDYYSDTFHYVGGITGACAPNGDVWGTVADCYNTAKVTDSNGYGYTGGIAGYMSKGKLESCFNVGGVSVGSDTKTGVYEGGIAGYAIESEISNCYNSALIYKGDDNAAVGGIVGYLGVTFGNGLPINPSTIKNCYNSGYMNASGRHTKSGMWGSTAKYKSVGYADEMFTNCYNDRQLTAMEDSLYGRTTDYLTSGTLPEGFSADIWQAEAGLYPVLKSMAETTASKLSSASIILADGEGMRKVKKNFTLNTPSGSNIKWGLEDSTTGGYTSTSAALSISGNQATIKDTYSTELLYAYPEGNTDIYRLYFLYIVPKAFDGEGTEASPYLIKTVGDFEKLQNAVAVAHQQHVGDFFKMTNDIDFAGSDFNGVCAKTSYYFGGTFDGGNHYIHNLKIEGAVFAAGGQSLTERRSYAGLFGACNTKSTLKNLKIADDCSFTFYSYSAPIAGYSAGKIENCYNYADVNAASQNIGGIVGYTASTTQIAGCYNSGNIRTDYHYVGGITGYNYGSITLSQNDGDVTAASIYGLTKTTNINTAGGISGFNVGAIDRCVNNGMVTSYKNVGGLTGSNSISVSGDITKSLNNGLVVCLSDDANKGGFIGNNLNKGTFADNYYDESINASGAASSASTGGVEGLSTSKLTSGETLTGLSTADFSFVAGSYPVLKAFENEAAAKVLRNIYLQMGDGEVVSNIKKNTALATDSNIKWTISQGKNFAIANGMLNVTMPTDINVVYDTLKATYGDTKYQKTYYLSIVPSVLDGAGTKEAPYLIKSKADMDKLADFIESTGMDYAGYYFKVMNDIDYAGQELKLLSTGSTFFQGDFDGNGMTIKGFTYENTDSKTGKNLGLFVNVGSDAVIHDLTLDGSINLSSYVGAFSGKLYGTLRNCVNKGTVTAATGGYAGGLVCTAYEGAVIDSCSNAGEILTKTTYAGGIAAQSNNGALIKNCWNSGKVTATTSYSAGITGSSGGKIVNCWNEGTVYAKTYAAGITGRSAATDTIQGCYNKADITLDNGGYVGGIFSLSLSGTGYMKDCYNTGKITGQTYVGGLGAYIQKGFTMENCWNEGDVKATTKMNCAGLVSMVAGDTLTSFTNIVECYNLGNVSGVATYTGGLTGNCSGQITMKDCFNMGDITQNAASTTYGTGGLSGSVSGKLINCWNTGSVTSPGYGIGGLSGIGTTTVSGCANFGDVTSTKGLGTNPSGIVGGIWGYGAVSVINSYNMGVLTAPDVIAGLVPGLAREAKMINGYSAGKIDVTGSTVTKASNVFGLVKSGDPKVMTLQNNYYDASINAPLLSDTACVGLTTQQMFRASLGDAYEYNKAAYPVNPNFKERAVPNFFASNIEYIEQGDTATNISGRFYVANLEGVTVTSSENISLADGVATPTATGEGWIKYAVEFKGKKFEKTFPLTIVKASTGIDGITDGGKEAISREYYDINGVRYDTLRPGRLNIVKSVFSDGTSEVRKVYVK